MVHTIFVIQGRRRGGRMEMEKNIDWSYIIDAAIKHATQRGDSFCVPLMYIYANIYIHMFNFHCALHRKVNSPVIKNESTHLMPLPKNSGCWLPGDTRSHGISRHILLPYIYIYIILVTEFFFTFNMYISGFSHWDHYDPWWQRRIHKLDWKFGTLAVTLIFVRTQPEAISTRAVIRAVCVIAIMVTATIPWFTLICIWKDKNR